jgi:hypothetical protein
MRVITLLLLILVWWNTLALAADEVAEVATEVASAETAVAQTAVEAETAVEATESEPAEEAEGASSDETDPEAKRWVYIYEDGCPVGYKVDEEWEFYEVEPKDIRIGNADLMREVSACGSEGGLMLGAAVRSGDADPQLALTGPAPDGPVASGQWRRRTNGKGDWQELYFDFGDADSYSVDYDRSTMRGNLELDHFTRNGNMWALQSDDDSGPTTATSHDYVAGSRDRSITDVTFRNGSAEGGSWRANLRHYDTEIGAGVPPQPDDSRLTRFELATRLAECNTTLDAGVFAGSYRSNRARLDNDFTGVRLDGSQWLGDRVELRADGSITRIDAGVQNASATRTDYHAELGWDMTCETRLSAFTRGYSDEGELSAGSTLRSWRDTGARLDYRPDGDTSFSAALSQRDINTERLKIEDPLILDYWTDFNPVPTREDLAGLRESQRADGELLDVHARHRFNEHFYLGASLRQQDFRNLPDVTGFLDSTLAPSYFADHREQASLHAAYDLCELGNITFRADTDHRSNSQRGSRLSRDQYTLGYSAPLCKQTRLGLGVTRQTTSIVTTSNVDDFDGRGWNYSLNLAGTSHCTNYVFSANRASSESQDGGDLHSLGLELSFDSPWEVSAWWRQFDHFLGGRSADDLGLQVGYRIEL